MIKQRLGLIKNDSKSPEIVKMIKPSKENICEKEIKNCIETLNYEIEREKEIKTCIDIFNTGTIINIINGYCDGACKGTKKGGWGCFYEQYNNNTLIKFISYDGKDNTTNQQMELTAMANMLRILPKNDNEIYTIVIHSDSKYTLQGITTLQSDNSSNSIGISGNAEYGLVTQLPLTGWIGNWINNGWMSANKKPVKNKELWEQILYEIKVHIGYGNILYFKWVEGHSGNEGNDYADFLANIKCT